jgi:hypothetical protein
MAAIAGAPQDAEPLAEHRDRGDLANVELGDSMLKGQAWEAVHVGVVFDDSPRDVLCCPDPWM